MLRLSYIFLVIASFLVACSEHVDNSQQIAIDSIRSYEAGRDSVLPVPSAYSSLEKVELPFNFSPEANFFPYLNLKYDDELVDQSVRYMYENAWKEAERNHDPVGVRYWKQLHDSLTYVDSVKMAESWIRKNARDSCELIYGDRLFYHMLSKDSLGNTIAEYLLDTANYAVRYWRLNDQKIYRAREQRIP